MAYFIYNQICFFNAYFNADFFNELLKIKSSYNIQKSYIDSKRTLMLWHRKTHIYSVYSYIVRRLNVEYTVILWKYSVTVGPRVMNRNASRVVRITRKNRITRSKVTRMNAAVRLVTWKCRVLDGTWLKKHKFHVNVTSYD